MFFSFTLCVYILYIDSSVTFSFLCELILCCPLVAVFQYFVTSSAKLCGCSFVSTYETISHLIQ